MLVENQQIHESLLIEPAAILREMEGENTMEKIIQGVPSSFAYLFWQSEVVWLLKSLCHGCQMV